jgi:hypothetical protein
MDNRLQKKLTLTENKLELSQPKGKSAKNTKMRGRRKVNGKFQEAVSWKGIMEKQY